MAEETGHVDDATSQSDTGVMRRGLLRFGALLTALTGASAITAIGASSAEASPEDPTLPTEYVPVSEKGAPLGVATLDVESKVPPALLPDLSATYADKASGLRVSDLFLSLGKYGVPGADNTAILAQVFADAGTPVTASGPRGHDGTYGPASRAVYIPSGVWTTTTTVTVPRGVSVIFANGAVVRARAAIAGPLMDTDVLGWEGQSITGGTLDCNLLARDGLRVRIGRYSAIRDLRVDDPTRHGVILGDTGLSPSSFEMKLHNVTVRRRTGQAIVAGSQGINIAKCSDSVFDSCVAISFETGFYNTGGDNRFVSCHAWGFAGAFPSYAFDDVSGALSHYSLCVADSPTVAGFRFRTGYATMSQCSVFLANTQTDNRVVGVFLDAGAGHFNASNNRLQGANGSVRLSHDYKGADTRWLATSTITGQLTAFTVAALPTRNTFAPYSTAGQLAERSLYIPGRVTVTDLPPAVFWSVPVQVDSVVIRSGSGTGTQFQIWQGGTRLTPTFNVGDVALLNSPFGSGTPVKLPAYAGLYIKVVTAGTGSNFSVVFKARQNG